MSANNNASAEQARGASFRLHRHMPSSETLIIVSAWLISLFTALVLAIMKGVPSPLRIFLHEVENIASRDWYWIGAVLPANLVAMAAARSSSERLRIAVAAVVIAVVSALLCMPFYDWRSAIYAGVKFCAIFGVFALVWQARRPGGLERMLIVVMFATYLAIRLSYLPITYIARNDTFDLYTFAFDKSMGFDIATFLFFLYHKFHLLGILLNAVYVFVLTLPISLYAAQIYRPDPQTAPMLRTFVLATTLGFFVYLIFPVSGPLYFLGSGLVNKNLLNTLPHIIEFRASYKNGMPSVHFAIVMLMTINVPYSLRTIKLMFISYCVLTFMATMGNGEHYFADLVAALPFVCMIQGFSLWLNTPRLQRQYLFAGLRSAVIFSSFLVIIIIEPEVLRAPPVSWTILTLLVVHFLCERHGWRNPDSRLNDQHAANRVLPPLAELATDSADARDPCSR